MAYSSSDVDELAHDPARRPPTPTQRRRASAPAKRGGGKKREVWPAAPMGMKKAGRSSKPSLVQDSVKGKGMVARVEAAEEEEEDQLADDHDQKQQNPSSTSTSNSAAKLEKFRFKGPKPAPMQEGPRSSSSVAISSEAEPLAIAAQKKKRSRYKIEGQDQEFQPGSAKRPFVKPTKPSVQPQPKQPQQSLPKTVDVPRMSFPYISAPAQPAQPDFVPDLSASKLAETSIPSTFPASPRGPAKDTLSSPFRPALQPSHGSNLKSPSALPIAEQASQPFWPARRQGSPEAKQPSSPSSRSSFSCGLPSSIDLPTQVRTRMRGNDKVASYQPAPVLTLSSTPELTAQVAASRAEQVDHSSQVKLAQHDNEAQRLLPVERLSPPSSMLTSTSRSQPHPAPPRTQKSLTAAQQHEVDELLEGLIGDEGMAGAFEEDWVETIEVEGGEGAEKAPEQTNSLTTDVEPTNPPPHRSQLSSSKQPHSSSDPFGEAVSQALPHLPSLTPVAAAAQQARALPAADSIGTSPRASALPSGPSHRSCSTSFSAAYPVGLPVSTSDLSTSLPLSLLRTPPKSKPQFRLVPLTVDGLTSHLRELVSSIPSASGAGGAEGETILYLRREVERLTREILSRDSTISSLSTSLASTSSALTASLEREGVWQEKDKEWAQERKKNEAKVDGLREVRRGLLDLVEEERERRKRAEEAVRGREKAVASALRESGEGDEGVAEHDSMHDEHDTEESEKHDIDQEKGEEMQGEAEEQEEEM
ncbi:hypothetical protein JCM11251_005459 [Rhodosporidiobolus azoricus]